MRIAFTTPLLRAICACAVLLWAVVLLWPSVVLVRWAMDREHIVRELCVQRALPREMNHCQGHCQLSMRLKQTEAEANAALPQPRVEVFQTIAEPMEDVQEMIIPVQERTFPRVIGIALAGRAQSVEHVPRG